MKIFLLTAFFNLALFLPLVSGKIYYADNNSNIGNTGSKSDPFSIDDINRKSDWDNGDIIILRSGIHYRYRLTLEKANPVDGLTIRGSVSEDQFPEHAPADWNNDGKPNFDGDLLDQPILIANSNIGDLTLKGIQLKGSAAYTGRYAVRISAIENLTIDGLDGNGRNQKGGASNAVDAFLMLDEYGANPVQGVIGIKNCTISGYGPDSNPDASKAKDSAGILFYIGEGENTPHSLKIHDNKIYNMQSDAILINGWKGSENQKAEIYNNVLYNCGENSIDSKCNVHLYIHHNVFYRDHWGPGGNPVTKWIEPLVIVHNPAPHTGTSHVYIYENEFNGNRYGDEFSSAVDLLHSDSNNLHFYRNRISDCYPAVYIDNINNSRVYNNVISLTADIATAKYQNDSSTVYNSAIVITGKSTASISIYGNTIKKSASVNHSVFTNPSISSSEISLYENNISSVDSDGPVILSPPESPPNVKVTEQN